MVREVIPEDGRALRDCETRVLTDLASNGQTLLAAKGAHRSPPPLPPFVFEHARFFFFFFLTLQGDFGIENPL